MSKNSEILEEMRKITHKLDRLENAFPGGDIEGHRRAHESMIEDVRARKELAKVIKEKTVSGLVWACLVWGGAALWQYLTSWIHTWMHK